MANQATAASRHQQDQRHEAAGGHVPAALGARRRVGPGARGGLRRGRRSGRRRPVAAAGAAPRARAVRAGARSSERPPGTGGGPCSLKTHGPPPPGSSRAGARPRASRRRRRPRCARPAAWSAARRAAPRARHRSASRSANSRAARACAPSSPASVSGSPTTTRSASRSRDQLGDRGEARGACRAARPTRAGWRACRWGPDRAAAAGLAVVEGEDAAHPSARSIASRAVGERLRQLLRVASARLRHRVAAASAAAGDLGRRLHESPAFTPRSTAAGAKFATRCTRPSTAVPSTTARVAQLLPHRSESSSSALGSGALDRLRHAPGSRQLGARRPRARRAARVVRAAGRFGCAPCTLRLQLLDRATTSVLGHAAAAPRSRAAPRALAEQLEPAGPGDRLDPAHVRRRSRSRWSGGTGRSRRWSRTCVPPHSSRETPSISTIRTTSPYFSPNSAIAPSALGLVAGGLHGADGVVLHDPAVHRVLDRASSSAVEPLAVGEVEAQLVRARRRSRPGARACRAARAARRAAGAWRCGWPSWRGASSRSTIAVAGSPDRELALCHRERQRPGRRPRGRRPPRARARTASRPRPSRRPGRRPPRRRGSRRASPGSARSSPLERAEPRLRLGCLVAHEAAREAGGARELDHLARGPRRHRALDRRRGRALAGALHQLLEALVVHRQALLGEQLLGQLVGEAVGVVQLEGVLGGDPGGLVLLRSRDQLVEQPLALVERAAEALLLGRRPLEDRVALVVSSG